MMNNNIKNAREELEMTQSELGYIFGVSKSTISNWENGYDIIPLTKLIKLCNLYNLSLDYICGFNRKNKQYNSKIKIDKKILGNKLKELRDKLNLTQQDLADECSISRSTYCHYEIGMNLISTIALYTICKNHKISIDEFLRK